jgi:catechol 2,3-dioxygenase-like lactoylglutathione lyase family enzyme
MDLNQITLPATVVAAATEFSTRIGFRLIVEAIPNYVRFECPEGVSTFSVHRVERMQDAAGIYVYFECKNLDQTVNDLQKKGISFDEQPNDKRWLWREARLKDPAGNQIILYHGGENRKYPPWRLKD